MGSEDSKIESILSYYLFQRDIIKHLNNQVKDNEESQDIKEGYLIHPEWIDEWKKKIEYKTISKYLYNLTIKNKKLDSKQLQYINDSMKKENKNFEVDTSYIIKNNNFMSIRENIITKKSLEYFVDEDTFEKLKVKKLAKYKKIKYIFKNQMIIFFFDKRLIIKVLIHSLFPFKTLYNLINLKINIYNENKYDSFYDYFRKNNSQNIIKFFININIFGEPKFTNKNKDNKKLVEIINEEEYNNSRYSNINGDNNKNSCKIIPPQEINFSLAERISFRGLDNVGATCYMNATLQCLANIKPLTDYLLDPNKYVKLYENIRLCLLTLKYAQVLIGLFCNENKTGSYCPEDFKNIISEYNPLFEGVKANDSKDLIIFLLEILNTELVKVHNKSNANNNNNENENDQNINISDEKSVFTHFSKDFQKNYCSIIGYNLYGFQKSVFVCQNCQQKSINFNIFNLLIFGLEAISNYFNLSNNNSIIPFITFDHCFQFLSKVETFQDTYCQNCRKTLSSNYKETIYYMPNYLIIILNRGKGNIFNCNVQIQESFSPSIYVEKENNIQFNLIGIVSHFGESGMGGHFIAFCKHYKDNKWRCYNDSIVTECQNDYLQKGTPYILFYKKEVISPNGNNAQIFNNNQNNNNINFNNSQPNLNLNNNNYQQNNINNPNMIQQNINNNIQQQNTFQNINLNINNLQQQNLNMNCNIFQQQNMNMNNSNYQQQNFQQQNMNMNNNIYQQSNMNLDNNIYQQQNMNMNNNIYQQQNFQQQNMNMNNNIYQQQNMNMNNNFYQNNNNNFQHQNQNVNNINYQQYNQNNMNNNNFQQ